MNQSVQNCFKVVGTVMGSVLMGLPVTPIAAIAQTNPSPAVNPCPGIYYEEPFNQTRLVPNGCPPNAATQRSTTIQPTNPLNRIGPTGNPTNANPPGVAQPLNSNPRSPLTPNASDRPVQPNSQLIQAPLPESVQPISAVVAPQNGMVNVRLVNGTGAIVVYQVIGDTNERLLAGQGTTTLQNLPAPVTVTFYRQDRGLLQVQPRAVEPGVLEVNMNATEDFSADKTTLRIQPNGTVLLN